MDFVQREFMVIWESDFYKLFKNSFFVTLNLIQGLVY